MKKGLEVGSKTARAKQLFPDGGLMFKLIFEDFCTKTMERTGRLSATKLFQTKYALDLEVGVRSLLLHVTEKYSASR